MISFNSIPELTGNVGLIGHQKVIALIGRITNLQTMAINNSIYPTLIAQQKQIEALEKKVAKLEKGYQKVKK